MQNTFETQPLETISAPAPAHAAKSPARPLPARGPRQHSGQPGRKHNRALIALGVAAGIIALAYGGGVLAFSRIYYPNTHIAGVEVSLMGPDAAISRVESASQNYALTIEGNDFSYTFRPGDGPLPVDVERRAHELLESNQPFSWPARLIKALAGDPADTESASNDPASEPRLAADFDEEAFRADLIAAIDAYNEGRSGVFDAASAYDEDKGAFTIEKAKANVKLDADRAVADALDALSSLESKVELDADDFAKLAGDATDAELEAACEAANELIGVDVSLKMGGATVATLDGAQMATWITFDESLSPSLDGEALTAWAQELDDGLDTVGTERTYTRPDGKVITVGGGTYGWIVDSAKLVEAIQAAVQSKQTGDLQVPLKSEAATFTKFGEKDWAEYVDVDITEQHARYYDANGQLVWESGCITGNPNLGNQTPTGIYRMNACSKNVTLVGAKDPETGEPEYRTPVSYWMPFVGGAIGLHDANWQASSSFSNPKAYLSVGSHGCINLPSDKAGELFGLVKSGICVIVHN